MCLCVNQGESLCTYSFLCCSCSKDLWKATLKAAGVDPDGILLCEAIANAMGVGITPANALGFYVRECGGSVGPSVSSVSAQQVAGKPKVRILVNADSVVIRKVSERCGFALFARRVVRMGDWLPYFGSREILTPSLRNVIAGTRNSYFLRPKLADYVVDATPAVQERLGVLVHAAYMQDNEENPNFYISEAYRMYEGERWPIFVALRDIEAGEMLTIDYGSNYDRHWLNQTESIDTISSSDSSSSGSSSGGSSSSSSSSSTGNSSSSSSSRSSSSSDSVVVMGGDTAVGSVLLLSGSVVHRVESITGGQRISIGFSHVKACGRRSRRTRRNPSISPDVLNRDHIIVTNKLCIPENELPKVNRLANSEVRVLGVDVSNYNHNERINNNEPSYATHGFVVRCNHINHNTLNIVSSNLRKLFEQNIDKKQSDDISKSRLLRRIAHDNNDYDAKLIRLERLVNKGRRVVEPWPRVSEFTDSPSFRALCGRVQDLVELETGTTVVLSNSWVHLYKPGFSGIDSHTDGGVASAVVNCDGSFVGGGIRFFLE